jgi:methyl-accepting chemotaxis protein
MLPIFPIGLLALGIAVLCQYILQLPSLAAVAACITAAALVAAAIADRRINAEISRLAANFQTEDNGTISLDRQVSLGSKLFATISIAINTFLGQTSSALGTVREINIKIATGVATIGYQMQRAVGVANEQHRQSSAIVDASGAVATAVEAVGHSAHAIAATAASNANEAEQAFAELAASVDSLQTSVSEMEKFSTVIASLLQQSNQVLGTARLINDISDQTNLLALNAAIEAARAGEAGRGFAVVADEVRKLANNAKDAANVITAGMKCMGEMVATTQAGSTTTLHHSRQAAEVAQRSMARFRSMTSELAGIAASIGDIDREILQIEQQAAHISHDAVAIQQGTKVLLDQVDQAAETARGVGHDTEAVIQILGNYTLGETTFDRIFKQVRGYRSEVESRLAGLADRLDLWDSNYRPIAGTDPAKYETSWDRPFASEMTPFFDRMLQLAPATAYAIVINNDGYAAAHNSKSSQALTGEQAVDFINSRDKRKFTDTGALRASRSDKFFLLQTYVRDTGEVLCDLSMPVMLQGRRWGTLRIGIPPAQLLSASRTGGAPACIDRQTAST